MFYIAFECPLVNAHAHAHVHVTSIFIVTNTLMLILTPISGTPPLAVYLIYVYMTYLSTELLPHDFTSMCLLAYHLRAVTQSVFMLMCFHSGSDGGTIVVASSRVSGYNQ